MDVETRFLEFCHSRPEGITDKEFRDAQPDCSPADMVKAVNSLLTSGLIELVKDASGGLIYRAIKQEEAAVISQLDADERIVYQCIKSSENRGIWTKDLKTRTNLHQTVLNKVLKSLEVTKRLIKSVKSVKNPTRKVYMLVGLNPSVEITGGPWFSESELDVEFINELCRVCLRFIASKSFSPKEGHILPVSYTNYPTLSQIHSFIIDSGITSIDLSVADVLMLVNRLVYDGEVEKIVRSSTTFTNDDDEEDEDCYMYRAVKTSMTESALASLPCGNCPVFDLCSDKPPITPSNCEYYQNWLSSF